MKRSYGQYCALARGLDAVGGRWTLLIVRELLAGPRRFTDLLGGLPGIGTNLLSDRLSELQLHGIIVKRTLPPPAGSDVYELTESGRELGGATGALVRWALPQLGSIRRGEEFRVHWLLTACGGAFVAERAEGVELTCEVRSDDWDEAHFTVADRRYQVRHGPASDPTLTIAGKPPALIALFSGGPATARTRAAVEVDGPEAALHETLSLFGEAARRP